MLSTQFLRTIVTVRVEAHVCVGSRICVRRDNNINCWSYCPSIADEILDTYPDNEQAWRKAILSRDSTPR